jgi:hypothetical protein
MKAGQDFAMTAGQPAVNVVKPSNKTIRSRGDMVDEYVRKVRRIDEIPDASYDVEVARPLTANVPGWHITQDLPSILKTGAMTNKAVGAANIQGWKPAHIGGAYFYSDPRLAKIQRERLMEMVQNDPTYSAEFPILRAQLRQANRLVPDEDVSLNIPWQESYKEGSFATQRPVLINQIDRIYSADPSVTKDIIRDSIIRQRRSDYLTGGPAHSTTPKQAKTDVTARKHANGGTVSQPQSLDAMKYELMMRSK